MNLKYLESILGISRNKSGSDYNKWRENKFINANSHSLNVKVLLVYHEILEHEWSDSDYWTCGSGNEIIASQLSEFDICDWQALETDLPNWHLHQLDLFCDILTAEYDQGSIAESIVAQRSYIYGYIITIVDILSAIDFMGEFEFLKQGGVKPTDLLKKLNELFDRIEVTPLIVGNGIDTYLRKERFDYLKSILVEISKK
jgi:hypothetical protein